MASSSFQKGAGSEAPQGKRSVGMQMGSRTPLHIANQFIHVEHDLISEGTPTILHLVASELQMEIGPKKKIS